MRHGSFGLAICSAWSCCKKLFAFHTHQGKNAGQTVWHQEYFIAKTYVILILYYIFSNCTDFFLQNSVPVSSHYADVLWDFQFANVCAVEGTTSALRRVPLAFRRKKPVCFGSPTAPRPWTAWPCRGLESWGDLTILAADCRQGTSWPFLDQAGTEIPETGCVCARICTIHDCISISHTLPIVMYVPYTTSSA